MRRTSLMKPLSLLALVAMANVVMGQPSPTPTATPLVGPGPFSSTRPAFVNLAGKPSGTDPAVVPAVQSVGSGLVLFGLSGIPNVPTPIPLFTLSQSSPGGMYDTITRNNHPFEIQTVQVTGQQGNRATVFTMTAGPAPVPGKRVGRNVMAPAAMGFGTATMHPLSGGFSNGITLSGTTFTGRPISADVSFVRSQPGASGQPEYIGIPYAVLQTLNTLAHGVIDPGGQAWVPLTASTPGGIPDTIQFDLSNQGGPGPTAFFQSMILAPGAGNANNIIPTLSFWGIASLSLTLAAFGLFQLRRGGFSIGI